MCVTSGSHPDCSVDQLGQQLWPTVNPDMYAEYCAHSNQKLPLKPGARLDYKLSTKLLEMVN